MNTAKTEKRETLLAVQQLKDTLDALVTPKRQTVREALAKGQASLSPGPSGIEFKLRNR